MSQTIGAMLQHTAARSPEHAAVHMLGEDPLSYAELARESQAFAATLQRDFAAVRHVALIMPNTTRWITALYGCAMAGKLAVLVNPRLTDAELGYQVMQSQSGLAIASDPGGEQYHGLFSQLAEADYDRPVIWAGEDAPPANTRHWSDWLDYDADPAALPHVNAQDSAVIIYTSGTTSRPKGVELSHAALVGNAERVGVRFGASADDRILSAGPFFHSGGVTMHVLLSAVVGACAYSLPAFDAQAVVDLIERERITIYNGIETLFLRLAKAPGFSPERMRSVRTGWATGTPAILDSIADDIGMPGVICVYGISEAAPNVLMSRWDDSREHRLHTVGYPQTDTRCRVVDLGTDTEVASGATGELLVKGPGLMKRYFDKPEETRDAFINGWLRTGDLVSVRADGYFNFAGRAKDIVRTGGENVSCAEVEDAIYAVSSVELAAVFGVEDDTFGEIVVAAVTPGRGETEVDGPQLIEKLRERLAGYKVPKKVIMVASMPLTQSGKVQKAQLRERIRGDVEGGDTPH